MPTPPRTQPRQPGFRLGVYVFKDAEVIDYAAPIGVFSVAHHAEQQSEDAAGVAAVEGLQRIAPAVPGLAKQ